MKNFLKQITNSVIAMQIVLLSLTTAVVHVNASQTFTNWDGLVFNLVLPQTNITAGNNVPATIVVSNSTEVTRYMRVRDGICGCGFASFSIVEVSSRKTIKCALGFSGDASSFGLGLQGHKSQSFDFDLKVGYGLTRAGDYSVQASGWFPLQEPPNGKLTNIITPPIIISLTNPPPK